MNLSIKNVPDDVVELLKKRAASNHRSLQGELRAIVEESARKTSGGKAGFQDNPRNFVSEPHSRRFLTIPEARAYMQSLGVKTEDNSTEIIRRARDER